MARGEDKAIAIQPAGFRRVVYEGVPEKNGPDLSAPKGETKVARRTGVDGIHGQTTGFSGGALQSFSRKIHSL
jgi:hypothetical protein